MARKLPWLAGGPKKGRNDERPEKSTAVKRRRIAAERLGSESDGETGSRKEKCTPRESMLIMCSHKGMLVDKKQGEMRRARLRQHHQMKNSCMRV